MKTIPIILGLLIGTVVYEKFQIHRLEKKVIFLEEIDDLKLQIDSVQNLILIKYMKP